MAVLGGNVLNELLILFISAAVTTICFYGIFACCAQYSTWPAINATQQIDIGYLDEDENPSDFQSNGSMEFL